MSDTPRTDKAAGFPCMTHEVTAERLFEHARTLERELNEARRIIMEQSNLRITAEDGLAHMTGLKNRIHENYAQDLIRERTKSAALHAALTEADDCLHALSKLYPVPVERIYAEAQERVNAALKLIPTQP